MGGFYELEESLSVGDVERGAPQFLVEARVVEQIQVLQHQQPGRLIVRIGGKQASQVVEGLLVQVLRMLYQLCQVHLTSWPRLR